MNTDRSTLITERVRPPKSAGEVVGLLAGLGAADAVERAADRGRAENRAVSAVLAEDAEDRVPDRTVSDHRVWATVRWSAPDGSTRTDEARVPPGARAGSAVTVWTDKSGNLTSEPLTDGEARLRAAFGGVLAAAGASGAVWGVAWGSRLYLNRCRMQQWAAEWERVGTRFGRKTG
ncbi:hypothetical protein ADL12_09155 [Streptomyces regalis]|uniref:Uncharacterized protein n=1 Tax=Streptomyces regalis TaxID=68262 RepID=A0A0X3VDC3_9ACTN|nr:hypothetical protein ADL12_09155 [Streptomyces regalis]